MSQLTLHPSEKKTEGRYSSLQGKGKKKKKLAAIINTPSGKVGTVGSGRGGL